MVAIHSVTSGRNDAGSPARCWGRASAAVGRQLAAEVVALLQIGDARCQLSAEREPAPPAGAAMSQRDQLLLASSAAEERRSTTASRSVAQIVGDAVVADREEAELAARPIDLLRPSGDVDVDDRQHALQPYGGRPPCQNRWS